MLSVGKRTTIFESSFGWLRTIAIHFPSGFADRNAIFSNRKIVFVRDFDATFFIKINKRNDVVFTTVNVIRHKRDTNAAAVILQRGLEIAGRS